MNFEITDEQQQLADSLRKYLANEYTFEKRKAIVNSPTGHSAPVWAADSACCPISRTWRLPSISRVAERESDGLQLVLKILGQQFRASRQPGFVQAIQALIDD